MFAVIKSGGRQYKVSVGERLEVNRLPFEQGKQIQIAEVLLISDADLAMIGAPFVENALVVASVKEHTRGEKLIVFKYKSKKRYRHRRGHRQELTVLTIDDIVADGKSLLTGEPPRAQEEPSDEEEAQTAATEQPVEETSDADTGRRTRRRRTTDADEAESTEE